MDESPSDDIQPVFDDPELGFERLANDPIAWLEQSRLRDDQQSRGMIAAGIQRTAPSGTTISTQRISWLRAIFGTFLERCCRVEQVSSALTIEILNTTLKRLPIA